MEISNPSPDQIFLTDGQNSNAPVVLIFGWAGSTDQDLKKYSKIYEDEGFVSIRHVTPKFTIFYDVDTIPVYSRGILEFLLEKQLQNRPLFVHMFSLMGATELQFLDILLFQEKYSKIRENLRGLVFDSCPGRRTIKSFFHAMADHVLTGSYLWRWIQAVGQFLWVMWSRIASGGKDDRTYCFEYFMQEYHRYTPLLLLFSRDDQCINVNDVNEIANAMEKKGIQVTRLDFQDSIHVGHFDKYPEKYYAAVKKFILHLQ